MLFFLEMQLLVVETNRYYHQYLETVVEGWSPLLDVTIPEMYFFLSIIMQMGHDQTESGRLLVYTRIVFYGLFWKTMKWDRFYHTSRFLHFSDKNITCQDGWKLWQVEKGNYFW
jgi:hypothetical protein